MSETVARQRPSVDMDVFERHLQQAQHQPPHQAYPHEDDPLAELARIVGEQPDPYGDVFAQQPALAAQHEELRPSFDPHDRRHARQEPSLGAPPPRFSADFAAIEAGLRGALGAPQPAEPLPPALYEDPHAGYGYEPEPQYAVEPPQSWAEPAKPARAGSRRPVYTMAASIAVAVVGIGVAFAYKGTGSSPREIKTIMAAAGPTKVQPPADQTASADTDADASVSQQPATKLVSREEQPVDLAQAVQDNAAARGAPDAANVPVPQSPGQAAGTMSPDYSSVGGAAPDTASAGTASPAYEGGDQAGFGVGMPKPKRVKSVSVTPDGRIVNEAAADPAPREAPAAPAAKSSDRAGPVTGSPLFSESPKEASKEASKSTSRAKSHHRVAAAQPADDNADDAPTPAKAKKAKPVKLASAETGANDAGDAAAAEEPRASGSGGYAVQLAAPGSESDARSATTSLLKKYGGALHGRKLGFHRAEANGRTVYRVRVSSLTREDATSLCSKLKSDGGSCFVAKN